MSMEQESVAPFTASDGVTLFRRVYEPAGEPLGELLLGHGIGENSSRYIQAARAFAAAGWRTTTWDLRGHGRSEGPRGYVKEFRRFHLDLAEQVSELQRSGRLVVVVSHSLGGLIAFGAVAAGLTKPDFLVLSAPALEARIATWKRVVAPILSRILPMLRIPTGIGADTSPGQRLPPAPQPGPLGRQLEDRQPAGRSRGPGAERTVTPNSQYLTANSIRMFQTQAGWQLGEDRTIPTRPLHSIPPPPPTGRGGAGPDHPA